MGQSYSVEAKFKFKNNDSTSFCKVFKDEVKARNDFTAIFKIADRDMNKPFDCFNILTAGEAYADCDSDIWWSDFDGSYGWELVMWDIFSALLKECENGSYVNIWPDEGKTRISVKNGVVTIK